METALLIIGFIFIVLASSAIGIITSFMFQVDICGSNPNRDL